MGGEDERAVREPDRWPLRGGSAGRRSRQALGLVGHVIGHVDQPLVEAGPEACGPWPAAVHQRRGGRRHRARAVSQNVTRCRPRAAADVCPFMLPRRLRLDTPPSTAWSSCFNTYFHQHLRPYKGVTQFFRLRQALHRLFLRTSARPDVRSPASPNSSCSTCTLGQAPTRYADPSAASL
eukprot:scaffold18996_cov57-Phaeocystis_antarctica.AAC.1